MALGTPRRFFFDRIIFNLALILGLSQALLWYWVTVVLAGRDGPGFATGFAVAGLLALGNALAVPMLGRMRRRGGWRGRAARAYMKLGVATLLLGVVITAAWLGFLLTSGLLGAVGASSETALGVFRVASAGLVVGVSLLLGWGFTVGQILVDRTRVRVEIRGLDRELAGLCLVQISDLHIGNGLEGRRLERMVARTNALDPGAIVVTGDMFDVESPLVEEGARRLAALRAPLGVYAVLGNHDVRAAGRIAAALARLAPNIRLLRDEVVKLPVAAPLYLAGVEDSGRDWSARNLELEGLKAVVAARPGDGPVLLLAHRPQIFGQAARLGFPLVLAGHTHGGQLALPTPGGRYNLARFITPFTRGLYRRNGTTMYVNRGLGVSGPWLRINCNREIATIELQPGQSSDPGPAGRISSQAP